MLTVGADVGKFKTKIKWKGGVQGHLSKLSTYREVKDNLQLDDTFIIIEYNNQKYLAGELADREGQNFLNSPDVHKSNLVTLLNLLIELSRLPDDEFNVIVGNPFGINNQAERESLKKLIIGVKDFKVNGKQKRINIRNLGVAPEGLAAWYSDTTYEDVNIFDFGSSTIHAIAVRKKKLVDKRSHTFDFGFETMVDRNYEGLMESIKIQMQKKWDDGDRKIIIVGGKAPDMFKYVREYYPNSNPTMHNNYEYANSIGLYNLGVVAYERAN
jgi:hypothetical protein